MEFVSSAKLVISDYIPPSDLAGNGIDLQVDPRSLVRRAPGVRS